MKIRHREPYAPLRQRAYPEVGEQLDAIADGFRALRDQGITLPAKTLDWLGQLDAIKARHPKGGR